VFSPRQADVLIVAGRVSLKMAPVLRRAYDEMLEPRWVMAFGVCASSGGAFDTYAVAPGIGHLVPVDVYVPGCPPTPGDLVDGLELLQRHLGRAPVPAAPT
jgi:NADH-quinone oxidoreductase subunit B